MSSDNYSGIGVICPGCTGVYHECNELYDPSVPANGTMFRLREPWNGYGWTDFPKDEHVCFGGLVCPHCDVPYPDSEGHVTLDERKPEQQQDGEFICPVCKRGFKSSFALSGHMRSHK